MSTFWLNEAVRSRDLQTYEYQLPGEVNPENDSFTSAQEGNKRKVRGKRMQRISSSVNHIRASDDEKFSTPMRSATSQEDIEWAF